MLPHTVLRPAARNGLTPSAGDWLAACHARLDKWLVPPHSTEASELQRQREAIRQAASHCPVH